jgi:cupin-like protein
MRNWRRCPAIYGNSDVSTPELSRVSVRDLSVQRFLTEYVRQNQPVVVTGSLDSWNIESMWTPAALESLFGEETVQVYNNYFDLQTLMPLAEYLARNFGHSSSSRDADLPYVRWYTKLRDVEFCWADEVFLRLQDRWCLPEFLPGTDYALPFVRPGRAANPVSDPFPAKALFIAPLGARTSLHVDPWASCAVLCQLYGRKRWYLYSPDQASYLQNEFGVVDVTRPDRSKFPAFDRAQLTATSALKPGEVIYVPHGWFHQVECESDSVSLTWNFVHRETVESFLHWLRRDRISELDLSMLRFFYALPCSDEVAKDVSMLLQEA